MYYGTDKNSYNHTFNSNEETAINMTVDYGKVTCAAGPGGGLFCVEATIHEVIWQLMYC